MGHRPPQDAGQIGCAQVRAPVPRRRGHPGKIVGMDRRDIPSQTELEFTRDQALVGLDGRALRRAHRKGEKNRLTRGVYLPSRVWTAADDDGRYLLRISAVVLTR